MLEDDIYRTSTQYRLWSFTEQSLRSIRTNTNAIACDRVRAAVHRAREARQQSSAPPSRGDTPNPADGSNNNNATSTTRLPGGATEGGEKEIECLTPDEESELVQYYCEKTMELGDEYKPPLPTTVRATAIQYLRRFYLTNSPMTYHPKSIMPCALFLATKTDNFYMSLRSFTEHIPNASTEDIIAPEFLLTQGLRFNFDIRHPFRGLDGGIMELSAIAQGQGAPGPHHPDQTSAGLQRAIESIAPLPSSTSTSTSISSRIAKAHHNAREILKLPAQMTDAYFLYTPSQIWLAALLIADKPLAEFYLDAKLGSPKTDTNTNTNTNTNTTPTAMLSALRTKLTSVLTSCSTLLNSYLQSHASTTPDPARMKRLKQIGKKLYHCQNPEKIDLVRLNKMQKLGGSSVSASVSASVAATPGASASVVNSQGPVGSGVAEEDELERAAKKRKLEQEKLQKEKEGGGGMDMFGGELVGGEKKKAVTAEAVDSETLPDAR